MKQGKDLCVFFRNCDKFDSIKWYTCWTGICQDFVFARLQQHPSHLRYWCKISQLGAVRYAYRFRSTHPGHSVLLYYSRSYKTTSVQIQHLRVQSLLNGFNLQFFTLVRLLSFKIKGSTSLRHLALHFPLTSCMTVLQSTAYGPGELCCAMILWGTQARKEMLLLDNLLGRTFFVLRSSINAYSYHSLSLFSLITSS